ncbi:hypothetical protein HOY80DRAFT_1071208 [Tuber brumale]|nr:hypothetical protein HOY80DRAFT_1071208 [Tuber brumale]
MENKFKYFVEIQQMIFISAETARIIEYIACQPTIGAIMGLSAPPRESLSIPTRYLIFPMRHERVKVSRVRSYLSRKDGRKSTNYNDGSGGGDAVRPAQIRQMVKTAVPSGVASVFSEQAKEIEDILATLLCLMNLDEYAKDMTRDHYVDWSRCCQATFTYREWKRFDARPDHDIVDILGFPPFEIVQTRAEEMLKITGLEYHVALGGREKTSKMKWGNLWFPAEEGRMPIERRHVEAVFRRSQAPKRRIPALRDLVAGGFNSKLTLV